MIFTAELNSKLTPFGLHETVSWYRCNVPVSETLLSAEVMAQATQGNLVVYLRDLDEKGDFIIIYQADTAIEPTRAVVEATWNPKRYHLAFHTYGYLVSKASRLAIHTDPIPKNEGKRYLEPVIEGKLRWPWIEAPRTEVEAGLIGLAGYRDYDHSVTAKELTEEEQAAAIEAEIKLQLDREIKRKTIRGTMESQFAMNTKHRDGIAISLPEWQAPRVQLKGAEAAMEALKASNEAKPVAPRARTTRKPGKI